MLDHESIMSFIMLNEISTIGPVKILREALTTLLNIGYSSVSNILFHHKWMIDSKKEVNKYFGGNLFYYGDDWVTFWYELKYLSYLNFHSFRFVALYTKC